MSEQDVSRHEVEHAADHAAAHAHVPPDPNDQVVRGEPPTPYALIVAAVLAVFTLLAIVSVAVATGG